MTYLLDVSTLIALLWDLSTFTTNGQPLGILPDSYLAAAFLFTDFN